MLYIDSDIVRKSFISNQIIIHNFKIVVIIRAPLYVRVVTYGQLNLICRIFFRKKFVFVDWSSHDLR